jgi:HK97 family phage major capsid protein/HK97 family phage prohead protease
MSIETTTRPTAGSIEQRGTAAPALAANGARLSGLIPYGVESRDLGGWREVIDRGALTNADTSELLAVVEHDDGRVLGRFPGTLTLSDEAHGLRWTVELPDTRDAAEVRALIGRGDLRATSWRMTVAREAWDGDVRHVTAIGRLLDVSVVSRAAYGDHAAAELRAYQPDDSNQRRNGAGTNPQEGQMATETAATTPAAPNTPAAGTFDAAGTLTLTPLASTETPASTEATEQRSAPTGGGLRVEDRSHRDEGGGPIEVRMAEAARSVARGESRSLTAANAGALLPEALDRHVWDRLRATSVFLRTGVQVVTATTASVRLPRITSDAGAAFYAQATAITPSDPGLDEIVATPKALKSLVFAASEVVDDSDPSVLQTLQNHLLTVHATRMDQEYIAGAATSNPNGFPGLLNTAGTQTFDATGKDLWAAITTAAGALRAAGATKVVAIIHPWAVTAADLKRDDSGATSGTGNWLARPASLPLIYESALLPVASAKAPALVFDAGNVVVVRRQDTLLETDRGNEFNTDQVGLRARTRSVLAVPQPSAVVKVTNLAAVDPLA